MAEEDDAINAQVVKEIAADAFTDAIEIMAIIDTLEALNGKPDIIKAINDARAGRTAEHIKRALFTRLHFLVARGYSKNSREGDKHARRAFDLLKQPGVRAKVATVVTEADLADAEAKWVKFCADRRLAAFIHFRDKYLAHLGEPKEGIPLPTYGEVIGLAKEAARVFEKLALGAGVIAFALDAQTPAHKASAEMFWGNWKP